MQMRRDFTIYFILMLFSLGLAYYVSLPSKQSDDAQVEWVQIDSKNVVKVTWSEADPVLENTLSKDKKGLYWVSVKEKSKDGNAEPTVKKFRANSNAKDFLEGFAPLYVERVIGKSDTLTLAEYGLDKTEKTLVFELERGAPQKFKIGSRAYGSRDVFVLDETKGQVVLVKGQRLEDLEKAEAKLYERKIYDVDLDEVSSVVLNVGAAAKEFAHTQRDGSGALIWTEKGDAKNTEKKAYKTLMEKVDKIRVEDYASDEEAAQLSAQKEHALFKLYKGQSLVAELKFTQYEINQNKYWLWSSYLNTYVRLSPNRAETLFKDIESSVQ